MSDTVKKVAIPTLGGMLIAGWILEGFGVHVNPVALDTIFGLFVTATGLPILGMVWNGLKTLMGK